MMDKDTLERHEIANILSWLSVDNKTEIKLPEPVAEPEPIKEP